MQTAAAIVAAALVVGLLARVAWYGWRTTRSDFVEKRRVFADEVGNTRRVIVAPGKYVRAYTGAIAEVTPTGIVIALHSERKFVRFNDIVALTRADQEPIAIWAVHPSLAELPEWR